MKQLFIAFLTFTIVSCNNQTQDKITTAPEAKDTLKTIFTENEKHLKPKNKAEVDFAKHKDLLDIILLLPKDAFFSWDWKLEDRIKWYNEIKANNYYIDDDPDFFNQKYFEPDKAGFSIVDGFWSINIYKTSENSHIAVTDDITGDRNELNSYEIKSNTLEEYLDQKTLFSDHKELLKKKDTDEDCDEKFKELHDPVFQYNFANKNKIEIEGSWYLTEENSSNCLIGNAIIYNFNPQTKKFDVEKIYWKPKHKY